MVATHDFEYEFSNKLYIPWMMKEKKKKKKKEKKLGERKIDFSSSSIERSRSQRGNPIRILQSLRYATWRFIYIAIGT